jgi:hypothetical protein
LDWAPLASSPPPKSSLLWKGMKAMEITTQLGPSNQTVAYGRGIKNPRNRMTREKRRWRRIVTKAKTYLSRASAYGGRNTDERRNLPSLPVSSFPLPRPPAFSAARAQAQGARRRTFTRSMVARAPELPLANACQKFFLKPL